MTGGSTTGNFRDIKKTVTDGMTETREIVIIAIVTMIVDVTTGSGNTAIINTANMTLIRPQAHPAEAIDADMTEIATTTNAETATPLTEGAATITLELTDID